MKVMHYRNPTEYDFGPNVISICSRYWKNEADEISKGELRVTRNIAEVTCWICLRHINQDWPSTIKKANSTK